MFLLINRFKSDFKCKLLKLPILQNRKNDVILYQLLGQNGAIQQNDVIFLDQFFCKRYPISISSPPPPLPVKKKSYRRIVKVFNSATFFPRFRVLTTSPDLLVETGVTIPIFLIKWPKSRLSTPPASILARNAKFFSDFARKYQKCLF